MPTLNAGGICSRGQIKAEQDNAVAMLMSSYETTHSEVFLNDDVCGRIRSVYLTARYSRTYH